MCVELLKLVTWLGMADAAEPAMQDPGAAVAVAPSAAEAPSHGAKSIFQFQIMVAILREDGRPGRLCRENALPRHRDCVKLARRSCLPRKRARTRR